MSEPINPPLDEVIVGDVLKELQKLPDSFVDVTVTSPPYNKRKKISGWLISNKAYSDFDDYMPEEKYQEWQVNVLNELLRVTKPGGSLFYNHKIRWEQGNLIHPYTWVSESNWVLRQEIIWDRILAGNIRGWRFWQVDERIYWLYKPIGKHLVGAELESRHAKVSSIWQFKPVERTDSHPSPFPIELPIRAIYSMPGESKKVILDPFCGTGTTLVAAKILDHNFIGIDISPTYVEYTKERLENWESEKWQAEVEKKKHVVKVSFEERKRRGKVNWPFGSIKENAEHQKRLNLEDKKNERTEQ
jgi:modification methylase